MDDPRKVLATYLGQRMRLGNPELFVSGLTSAEVLRLAAEVGEREGEATTAGRAAARAPSVPAFSPRAPSADERPPAEQGEGVALPAHVLQGSYEELREGALGCRACRLAGERTQVVFSDGNPNGRLMVVGEAPGRNEDETGLPFVGQAGKLLDLMLASIDLSRAESVYIGNVLKCRPPGNRNPLPDEIDACAPLLRRQIELVSPEVILAVGSFAAQWLTGTQSALGKLRGTVYAYQGVPLVVTYHPAAILRNPGWSRATWDDLQLLRQVMDG